jgi:uncharacterized protein
MQTFIKIAKIVGKTVLLVSIWAGSLALISSFDSAITALGKPTSTFLYEFLPLLGILIPSLVLWAYLEKEKPARLGFGQQKALPDFFTGSLIGLVWVALSVGGLALTTQLNPDPVFRLDAGLLLIYFVILTLNAAMQEVLVRGYLFRLVERDFGVTVALIVTSLVFLLLHPGAINAGVIASVNVFMASLIFGIALVRSGNLWLPLGIHTVWNYVSAVFLGVMPLDNYPSMKWLSPVGDTLFTGGKNGYEAGVIVSVTALLVLGGLWFFRERQPLFVANGPLTEPRICDPTATIDPFLAKELRLPRGRCGPD